MRQLICIIGTDGSGKTSLSDEAARRMNDGGQNVAHVWLGAESYLMAPARKLLKVVWKRRSKKLATSGDTSKAQKTDYQVELESKNALAQRYRWGIRFYLILASVDYQLQLWLKLLCNRSRDTIIADRYVFDVAVNIGLTLGWSPEQVIQFVQRQLRRLPLPGVRLFLRVEPEVSASRKDDIPSIEYLRLRLVYYEALARAFGFIQRDGTLPISQNADWLIQHASAELARPHVHYVHANNEDVGGADKVLALMARHMRDHEREAGAGYRVSVSLRLPTPILETHASAGIPVILAPFVRPQFSGGAGGLVVFVFRAPLTLWYFLRLFGRQRPDIVHVNDLYDFLPALAARMRSIPVVYHIRMIQTKPAVQKIMSALVGRLSAVSVSVSEAVRTHYFPVSVPGRCDQVIHDLGNAILTTDQGDVTLCGRRPEGIPIGGRLVVMVGRIEEWKGQHVFVEAVRQLPNHLRARNVFCLVGGGVPGKDAYLSRVTGEARALGIHCLGSRDDVPAILRAADISVHASTSPDPFPGVVIESMLAGAAIIAADAGGVQEMIDPGLFGLLVAPGDAVALSAALCDSLEAVVPPRIAHAAVARRKALSLVDSVAVDKKMATLYRSLVPSLATTAPTLVCR